MRETKTIFASKEAIKAPAPMWATIAFRIVLLLCSSVQIWLPSTSLWDDAIKVEIGGILSGTVAFIWGLTKIIGVKITDPSKDESE